MTGPCAWRQGDFLELGALPSSFIPYLTQAETCPFVDEAGGGSVMLVILLIVVFPVGSILLIVIFKRFGPRACVNKCWKEEAVAPKEELPPKKP